MPMHMTSAFQETMRKWAVEFRCAAHADKRALLVHVQDHLEPDEKGDLQPPDFMLAEMRNVGFRWFMRREKLSPKKLGASHA